MNKANAKNLLRQFNFKDLFLNELGWDDHHGSLSLKVGEDTVILTAVAEKRGMAAYLCTMTGPGKSYDYQTRCRIEIQLAKSVREHLVIYIDSNRHFQIWQWVKRESGRPIARREHTYTVGQSGESLLQKLEALEVKIEDDEQLNLFGVIGKVKGAFDIDRITKRFYEIFKDEHATFSRQIDGIDDKHDHDWYASIMLNRLMFIYFIQKKGFLDRDKDYLRNRLAMIKKTHPKTKFLTFYRSFLIKLFHNGLGSKERSSELRQLLGTIPYLNGGIFAVHPLEEKHSKIDIPDKAFEKVFAFFDQYRWHLDERPLRADDEINPDVLGYIFEKYINQKQMGAYYTKEDITEYIAKNCIVPFIFDRVEGEMKKIGKDQEFYNMFRILADDPDRYIYAPVKHGVAIPLPKEIEDGIDTTKPNLIERRADWNRPAPPEYALPTETWREVVARRQRYAEIHTTLTTNYAALGINDLITLNLNIRQFTQDCIENAESPDLLWAFWKTIEEISVLDPTCGSGAFLFAALNVLEPLYEACLDRMKAFMLEWSQAKRVPHPNFYEKFASVIAHVEKHVNEKYFIYKSIIIRNLYGVDIMDEAVEICKLRLFLKLAAQIEPDYGQDNLGIEPLPDIDFNVRAGNTLIGFATEKQAKDVIQQDLLAYNTVWPEVQRDAKKVAELFGLFRRQQTEMSGAVSSEHKARLREKLTSLEERLNAYLADTYGVTKKNAQKEWVASHKPFHWFIEFYEIMANGGFDVIIGNPPYVEYSKVRDHYTLPRSIYTTETCGNLYAFVVERCLILSAADGRQGFILPTSSISTERMNKLQDLLHTTGLIHSTYGFRPSKLFEGGANIHLSILLLGRSLGTCPHALHHIKWNAEYRPYLFQAMPMYSKTDIDLIRHFKKIPRLANHLHHNVLRKMLRQSFMERAFTSSKFRVYYRTTGGLHYRVFTVFSTKSRKEAAIAFQSSTFRDVAFCAYASNLWNMFYYTYANCLDVSQFEVNKFPIGIAEMTNLHVSNLAMIAKELDQDLRKNAHAEVRHYKDQGDIDCYTVEMRESKPIIDKIDRALAKHYGFTEEELDFIINYDIKYRMGKGEADEDE